MEWLLSHNSAGLFLDPGAGKTSISYAACVVLKNAGMFHGMVVVAPLRPAVTTWPDEQQEWSDFHELDVVVLHGKNREHLASTRHDVYVINYEGLDWFINGGFLKNLLRKKWVDTLNFDELTKMKNASKKAKRRKLLRPWLPRFTRRWGLTGSPASNGLIHLFGQINILDLGRAFGPFITHFRNRFFVPQGMWNWRLKEGAEELIYEAIKPVALRLPPSKTSGTPAIRYNDIRIILPPDARAAYDNMEEEMLTVLNNELLTAGSAGAVYGKCCQIATGAVFKAKVDPITGEPFARKGDDRWHNVHDAKLDALEELIDELQGQQILVAYWFQHDLAKLLKRFGKNTPYIGSGVSIKRAKEIEVAWNDGDIPYMFGHPLSMGHGVNFQKSSARHVGWYTPIPDYELYDQFNRRIRRRGNKSKTVTVHHIVAVKTVESWGILPILGHRERTQLKLFDALRQHAKQRKGWK